MQAQHVMEETNLDADSTDTKQALRLVIAYDDLAAGQRAAGTSTMPCYIIW